jgi:hypothetical protein
MAVTEIRKLTGAEDAALLVHVNDNEIWINVSAIEQNYSGTVLTSNNVRSEDRPLSWYVDNAILTQAQATALSSFVAALWQNIRYKFPKTLGTGEEITEDLS